MSMFWNRLSTGQRISIAIVTPIVLIAVLAGVGWSVLNAPVVADTLGATPATSAAAPAPTSTPTSQAPADDDASPTGDHGQESEASALVLTEAEQAQAEAAALDALAAVVTQPAGETHEAREARLAPYFAPGSPMPGDRSILLMSDQVADLRIEPGPVEWAEPFDPGDGRIGLVIAITAHASGLVDAGATSWNDTSTQTWRITLIADDAGTWIPEVAWPVDHTDSAN